MERNNENIIIEDEKTIYEIDGECIKKCKDKEKQSEIKNVLKSLQ